MSVLTETLQDSARAFVDGFNRDILYLSSDEKNRVMQNEPKMELNTLERNKFTFLLMAVMQSKTYFRKC